MTSIDPSKIHYLAFEGGGGKGVTFLGAIEALHDLRILPIDINFNNPVTNQIKGFTGASAGAITALFLCMGYGPTEIQAKLSQREKFVSFFDLGGTPNSSREVSGSIFNWTGERNPMRREALKDAIIRSTKSHLPTELLFYALTKLTSFDMSNPLFKRLAEMKLELTLDLILKDLGIFHGFGVRKFFNECIDEFIKKMKSKGYKPKDEIVKLYVDSRGLTPKTFTFRVLKDMTNIDLVVTGVNTTTRKYEYFSPQYTPEFPVAEAVAISMNLPIIFKPIAVNYRVHPIDPEAQSRYMGLWVDGGLLNNLPMHYFDDLDALKSINKIPEPNVHKLNTNMLAFRLTNSSTPNEFGKLSPPFTQYVKDLIETILSPSETGQIRSKEEVNQTIDLDTGKLSTIDFTPDNEDSQEPIKMAKEKVKGILEKGVPASK